MKAELEGKTAGKGASTLSARRLARISLGLLMGLFALFVMMGPSFGAVGIFAQASPTASATPTSSASSSTSPSASPSPTTPAVPTIKFLNPSQSYDPGLPVPPRAIDPASGEFVDDPPKISDRFDGVDSLYHVSAWVGPAAPTTRVVELSIQYGTNNELTIGLMDEVPGQPNTYEFYWDIPESFAEGAAVMRVRLFAPNLSGQLEEVANGNDEVTVDVQHRDTIQPSGTNTSPSDETIELTYPTQNGVAGFFKTRGGTWKSLIEGISSSHGSEMDLLYTVSEPGEEVEYKLCGATTLYNKPGYGSTPIVWSAVCTLTGPDTPSQVTAIAAVVLDADRPDRTDSCCVRDELSQDSADVHRVNAYAQSPDDMVLTLDPEITTETTSLARRITGGCLAYMVTVKDELGRPVIGANIDVHMVGPNDQVQFADENAPTTGPVSGGYKNPDKGDHTSEAARDCDGTFPNQGTQGDHNVPAAADRKHRESTTGTGSTGTWRFHIISMTTAGLSDLTAWVDEEELAVQSDSRPLDTDILEAGEPQDTFTTQWYSTAPTLSFQPSGGTSVIGECTKYTVLARSGSAAIAGMNIDLHATGPDDQLDFCDPADASPRRAPDQPVDPGIPHDGEDAGESSHAGASPKTQHTEGETNDSGNFVFGVTSPIAGDTTLLAWLDKEPGYDNDVQDTGETSATARNTWGASLADATIRFQNPSSYAGVDIVSIQPDADNKYHLSARTDAAGVVPGVEFLISSSPATTFTSLGVGTRVGETDTYELLWNGSVANANYTLRTQIVGTSKFEDRTVAVTSDAESAEITRPANGAAAPFTKGATTVAGLASAGAEKVQIYYTKTSAGTTRNSASWTLCGTQTISGSGSAAQAFSTPCTVVASDQGALVTGIAAVAIDCDADFGCPNDPAPPPIGAQAPESGDAHRVFGFEADPIVSIEPAEAEAVKGVCKRFVLRVADQTGQAMPNQDVDVHLAGPTDTAAFCDPGDASARSTPDGGGHSADPSDGSTGSHQDSATADTKHTEGSTNSTGRFTFGVTSSEEGDSSILGWVDQTNNDSLDAGERSDTSTMHWVAEVGPEDKCTIRGTHGDDVIVGTEGDDVICGMGGNDVIRAKGGDDLIRAGFGNDTAYGGAGNDRVRGRQDSDRLFGGPGVDFIEGGRGRDRIDGGSGADSCVGGPGTDRVSRCE